jgi:hypothetical protein
MSLISVVVIKFIMYQMASQERFELPTVRLEGVCSIQLSYWDSVSIDNVDYIQIPIKCQLLSIFFTSRIFSLSIQFDREKICDSSLISP